MDIAKIRIGQLDLRDLSSSELASANSVNEVQGNLTALSANVVADANTWTNANDYTTYTTLSGLVDTVQDNVELLTSTAAANDYSTYTTLSGLIDTVQDNVGAVSDTTALYLGDTLISNSALIFETGNGISVSGNSTSKVVTFTVGMSNVTSQEFTANGASNSFTLAKSVANSHMILVSYNGILQKPTTYDLSGTTLTLSNTSPIKANSDIEVRFFDFFDLPGTSEGGGSGYSFQGSTSGYISGGGTTPTKYNIIEKFSFSADGNATDVGDLTVGRFGLAGQSSAISGYATASYLPDSNIIDKFPFSSDGNATDVGDLTQSRTLPAGQSSDASGYTSGGSATNTIDKFPFSSDINATDVGDLTRASWQATGQSSTLSGYTSGGAPGILNTIDKFPFATDANATDVGDLTVSRDATPSGQSSTTHGYTSGGRYPVTNVIDKFPFSTDSNATDVGDLTQSRYGVSGQSSTDNGYVNGGSSSAATVFNTIDKFPFATDANATDVGDMTISRWYAAGQQV